MRILIVEDDFLIAMALEDILVDAGHEVLGPFPTSAEAVAALASVPVDGAILDVRVSGGDSMPVASDLTRRGCPFVFVTGFGAPGMVPPAFAHARRLSKPYSAEDVLSIVAEFRRGSPADASRAGA